MELMNTNIISDCSVLDFPKVHIGEQKINPIEVNIGLPFQIKEVYYLSNLQSGAVQEGRAFKKSHQLLVAFQGTIEVLIRDGKNTNSRVLNQPNKGLLIVSGIWYELLNFSLGAICLFFTSELFYKLDCILDYNSFLKWKNEQLNNFVYDTVYFSLEGTIKHDTHIDPEIMKFIYECINNKIRIILFSRLLEEDEVDLIQQYKIEPLFNEVIRLTKTDNKSEFIKFKNSIFVDNDLLEREKVYANHHIPTFDSKMIELVNMNVKHTKY